MLSDLLLDKPNNLQNRHIVSELFYIMSGVLEPNIRVLVGLGTLTQGATNVM